MLPIIIVDDSEEDSLLLERLLMQCKILNSIHRLKSGKECVDYFKGATGPGYSSGSNNVRHDKRSLVFLDLIMSPLSGTGVLKALQREPQAKGSVIIMVSGLTDIKAIHEGYQLGAKTFLVKPIAAADVLQLVASLGESITVNEQPDGYALHWTTASKEISAESIEPRREPRPVPLRA